MTLSEFSFYRVWRASAWPAVVKKTRWPSVCFSNSRFSFVSFSCEVTNSLWNKRVIEDKVTGDMPGVMTKAVSVCIIASFKTYLVSINFNGLSVSKRGGTIRSSRNKIMWSDSLLTSIVPTIFFYPILMLSYPLFFSLFLSTRWDIKMWPELDWCCSDSILIFTLINFLVRMLQRTV